MSKRTADDGIVPPGKREQLDQWLGLNCECWNVIYGFMEPRSRAAFGQTNTFWCRLFRSFCKHLTITPYGSCYPYIMKISLDDIVSYAPCRHAVVAIWKRVDPSIPWLQYSSVTDVVWIWPTDLDHWHHAHSINVLRARVFGRGFSLTLQHYDERYGNNKNVIHINPGQCKALSAVFNYVPAERWPATLRIDTFVRLKDLFMHSSAVYLLDRMDIVVRETDMTMKNIMDLLEFIHKTVDPLVPLLNTPHCLFIEAPECNEVLALVRVIRESVPCAFLELPEEPLKTYSN